MTGYIDEQSTPLFPFGWGLSYMTFAYSATKIASHSASAAELNRDGTITVEATVTNTGSRDGAEVVQLYIRQRGTSVVRPVRELKGFQKIVLAAGESKLVKFTLTKKELAFWNIEMQHVVEPGELTVWIAPDSQSGQPAKVMIGP